MKKLSKKKRKYILRNARLKRPEELAEELGVPLKLVNKTLGKQVAADKSADKQRLSAACFWIIAAVLFVAPVAVYNDLYYYSRLPKSILIQVGAALLLFMWLLANQKEDRPAAAPAARLFLPLAVFLLWSLLSFFWATNRYGGFVVFVHWVACAVFCYVGFQVLTSDQRIRRVFSLLTAAAAVVSFVGLLQHYFGVDWIVQRAPPAATFGNKNMAAQFIGLCMPAGIAVFILERDRTSIWLSAASLALMATYLFHTQTKAAWLAVAGQIVFFFTAVFAGRLLKKTAFDRHKTAAGIASAAAVLVMINLTGDGWSWKVGGALENLQSVFTTVTEKPPPPRLAENVESPPIDNDFQRDSAGARLMIWRNSLKMIQMNPILGVGANNFGAQYAQTAIGSNKDSMLELYWGPRHAHNDYLQIAAELGLAAAVIFVWLSISIAVRVRLIFRSNASDQHKIIAIACIAALVDLAINSLASFPLYRALPPLIAGIYLAIIFRLSINPATVEAAANEVGGHKWPKGVFFTAAAISAMVLAAWAHLQIKWVIADRYSKLRAVAMSAREWSTALYWGEKSAQFNPYRPEVKHAMGRAHFELKNYAAALPYLLDYRKSFPHDTHNLFFLAKTYDMLEDYPNAEKTMLYLLSILPKHAASHDMLGRIYAKQNRHEDAQQQFRLATELAPASGEFFINRGAAAYKSGRFGDAAQFFEKAVELNPQSATARKNLGITLTLHLGRQAEGIQQLRMALELDPKIDGHQTLRQIVSEYGHRIK